MNVHSNFYSSLNSKMDRYLNEIRLDQKNIEMQILLQEIEKNKYNEDYDLAKKMIEIDRLKNEILNSQNKQNNIINQNLEEKKKISEEKEKISEENLEKKKKERAYKKNKELEENLSDQIKNDFEKDFENITSNSEEFFNGLQIKDLKKMIKKYAIFAFENKKIEYKYLNEILTYPDQEFEKRNVKRSYNKDKLIDNIITIATLYNK